MNNDKTDSVVLIKPVPAVAGIQVGLALFDVIGRKGCVDGECLIFIDRPNALVGLKITSLL